MNYAVVMAGGKGERFWPLSRAGSPKQFLKILSDKTLLEETLERTAALAPLERTLVVAAEAFKKQILEKVPSLSGKNLLLEPEGKNTAPAIALAAVHLAQTDPRAVMIVLPSDHFIEPKERLSRILSAAAERAQEGDFLITLGIVPTRAETGYGYIEVGEKTNETDGIALYKVARFKEKPNRTAAQEYYLDRKHFWNSGMFVWSAAAILKAFERHQPKMYKQLKTYSEAIGTSKEEEGRKKLFAALEPVSVDVAVLEKADNVLTIPSDFTWDDVGSFLALERVRKRDRENNLCLGSSLALSSYETTVINEGEGVVAVFGVSDLVVVKSGDSVLVAHKTRVADLKELTEKLASDPKYKPYL
ncbi:MAG: mannose-1-phosphate guanylyltransferase [candidate division Zixibacteria bacterium]|nr:mannose-1-phosphate guanylyltransferase [candidate division Zixibacteria bacterium]